MKISKTVLSLISLVLEEDFEVITSNFNKLMTETAGKVLGKDAARLSHGSLARFWTCVKKKKKK